MKGNAHLVNRRLYDEFISALLKSLPPLSEEEMKHWLSRQGKNGLLAKRLREALAGKGVGTAVVDIKLQEQVRFYQEVFGLTVDATSIQLPQEREGFGWLLLVPAEITINSAWAKCKERFACYSYAGDDLDTAIPVNERGPAKVGTYAIRLRDRVEADEEWKNTSAKDIASRKVSTITLLERILLELWYNWKSGGKHLDIDNWTLCGGSRDSGGGVPGADWRDGGFEVHWSSPGCSRGRLRSREAAVS